MEVSIQFSPTTAMVVTVATTPMAIITVGVLVMGTTTPCQELCSNYYGRKNNGTGNGRNFRSTMVIEDNGITIGLKATVMVPITTIL